MTKPAMVKTITDFLSDSEFYDLHLVSTLGYTDEDVEAFAGEDDVRYAEGSYSFDVLYDGMGDNERALKTLSLPEHVNDIRLVDGRLPEADDECVVDDKLTDVRIGDVITVADTNGDATETSSAIGNLRLPEPYSPPFILILNVERLLSGPVN